MTPVQFIVYDSMLHFAAPPDRLFFSTIIGIANNTNLCKDTVTKTLEELVMKGWLVPDPDNVRRWKNTGRWANFRYTVITHKQHEGPCPPLKYDPETGRLLVPSKKPHPMVRNRSDSLGTDLSESLGADRSESLVSTAPTVSD
jgi:hypothetical protein